MQSPVTERFYAFWVQKIASDCNNLLNIVQYNIFKNTLFAAVAIHEQKLLYAGWDVSE